MDIIQYRMDSMQEGNKEWITCDVESITGSVELIKAT